MSPWTILTLFNLVLVNRTPQPQATIPAVEVFLKSIAFSLFLHLAVACTVCTLDLFSLSVSPSLHSERKEAPEQMTCLHEDSLVCHEEAHWLWILFALVLLFVCLLYLLSRPNYARLSSHAYELISPPKQQNGNNNQQISYTDNSPEKPTNASCSLDLPLYWFPWFTMLVTRRCPFGFFFFH